MNTSDWAACPANMSVPSLEGDKLSELWGQLHKGNGEPFPSCSKLQDAWRHYHLGNFAQAVNIGVELGDTGLVPSAFATTIYAQYLETDEKRKIDLLKKAMAFCKEAEAKAPGANVHYMFAVAMGRYSQIISAVEA